MYKITSYKKGKFDYLLSNLDVCYFFSYLVDLTKTSNSMLNTSGESVLFKIVKILAMSLSYTGFIMLSYTSSIPNLLPLWWRDIQSCQMHFLYLLRWSYGFQSSFC